MKHNNNLKVAFWNKGGHWASKLLKKLKSLILIIKEHNLDLIYVSEANLKIEEIEKVKIPGYEIKFIKERNNRIVLIHKNQLVVSDTKYYNTIPSIGITVKKGKDTIRVLGTYREFKQIGGNNRTINEETTVFVNYLREINSEFEYKSLIWGGDFNLNYDKIDCDDYDRKDMLRILANRTTRMRQLVKVTTRNVKKSQTKIDLMFVKGIRENNVWTEIADSDHDVVLGEFNIKGIYKDRIIEKRDWRGFTKEALQSEARKVDWRSICWIQNINEQVKALTEAITRLFDILAPMKIYKLSELTKVDWRTPELTEKIRVRNKKKVDCINFQKKVWSTIRIDLTNDSRRRLGLQEFELTERQQEELDRNNELWYEYKRYNSLVRSEIKIARDSMIMQKISRYPDPKTLYREIRKLEGESDNSIPTLESENQIAVTNEEKAEMIHKAYIKKLEKVEEKLGPPEGDPMEVLINHDNVENRFNIRLADDHDIIRLIKRVPNKSSTGDDKISYVHLKYLKSFIAAPLRNIINKSLTEKVFPEEWKKAVISPLHKAGKDKTRPESYRPVSLISSLSRIAELYVSEQMDDYAESSGILPDSIHGYRKNRSCTSALLEVSEDIITAHDKSQLLCMTCLDVSAGFDTVSLSYLLRHRDEFTSRN